MKVSIRILNSFLLSSVPVLPGSLALTALPQYGKAVNHFVLTVKERIRGIGIGVRRAVGASRSDAVGRRADGGGEIGKRSAAKCVAEMLEEDAEH